MNRNTGSLKRLSMHATKNKMKRLKIIILLQIPQRNQHFRKNHPENMKLLFTSCIVKSRAKYLSHECCQVDGKTTQTSSERL